MSQQTNTQFDEESALNQIRALRARTCAAKTKPRTPVITLAERVLAARAAKAEAEHAHAAEIGRAVVKRASPWVRSRRKVIGEILEVLLDPELTRDDLVAELRLELAR